MAFLAAEAFDFGDGYAFDADFGEGAFHFVQFERFDDGVDQFHGESPFRIIHLIPPAAVLSNPR